MSFKVNFFVNAGATFTRQLTYFTPEGDLFDLTGYEAKLQVRESVLSETAVIDIAPTIDTTEGTITWTFAATDTANLDREKYIYAMEISNDSNGNVIRLIEGDITISPKVVR